MNNLGIFFHQQYRIMKSLLYKFIYDTDFYKIKYNSKLNNFFESNQKYTLVVCHNGGGGTVSYMKNKYAGKEHVLFLRDTVVADKDYLYSLENSDTKEIVYFKPKKIGFIRNNISNVHVIAVESYMSLQFILNWFISLNVPVIYDIHDYHCIWYETHFIHDGKYLTRADLEKSVLKYAGTKITFQQWHKIWSDFLPHVQTINAFSESSKNIFAEFYPEFANKIKVTPHSLDYIKCGTIEKIPSKFCIGIFGLIYGADKGCNVVKNFLNYSKNKDYQIFINGDINNSCKVFADNIHYMGRYNVNKLDKIIEEQGISTVLFPSICPETFSYTVSELIHVGVPIACFNLGAQAEKVSSYKFGEIISSDNNESIFNSLYNAYLKGQNNAE